MADQSFAGCTQFHCGSEPAREGGLTADQSFAGCTQFYCGSEPAREEALSGNVHFTLPTRSTPDAKSTAITTEYVQFTGACRALGYKE
jgi:hypothetical protein